MVQVICKYWVLSLTIPFILLSYYTTQMNILKCSVEHVENLGIHYYQTLRCWRKNFMERQKYALKLIEYVKFKWLLTTTNYWKCIYLLTVKFWLWGLMRSSLGHGNTILITVVQVSSHSHLGITRYITQLLSLNTQWAWYVICWL